MTINIKPLNKRILTALTIVLLGFSMATLAQPNTKQWRDLLLYSDFGEFCTMCEAAILCAENKNPSLEQAQPVTLYHLQTRTFWSQITTIWEWFVANFETINGHTRPVVIYNIDQQQWGKGHLEELSITVEPALIRFSDAAIDRKNRHWLSADTLSPKGYCKRLPLWETIDLIENNSHD